jgi:hypothetical protein
LRFLRYAGKTDVRNPILWVFGPCRAGFLVLAGSLLLIFSDPIFGFIRVNVLSREYDFFHLFVFGANLH